MQFITITTNENAFEAPQHVSVYCYQIGAIYDRTVTITDEVADTIEESLESTLLLRDGTAIDALESRADILQMIEEAESEALRNIVP